MRNRIIQLIDAAAAADPQTVFLTGDLGYSVVEPLMHSLGERFINMGVAEANMASVAASLAATCLKPYAYSIVPFITARCFEQIRNDICYQKRGVRLIGVGSGFSYGTLGPSHHALEDTALMASLPGLRIVNPANVAELDRCFAITLEIAEPVYFRIARESGSAASAPMFALDAGAYVALPGTDVCLIASGVSVADCLTASVKLAAEGISASVVSVPVLAPLPRDVLLAAIGSKPVVCVFEGYSGHPLEVGLMRALLETNHRAGFASMTAPHRFCHTVGSTTFLRKEAGLDADSIARVAAAIARRRDVAVRGAA